MRIWVKIVTDGKIIKDTVFKNRAPMSLVNLTEALKDVCYEFDLPTPLLIDIQYRHFVKFNIVTLTQKDFIENVDFDKFIIENWI